MFKDIDLGASLVFAFIRYVVLPGAYGLVVYAIFWHNVAFIIPFIDAHPDALLPDIGTRLLIAPMAMGLAIFVAMLSPAQRYEAAIQAITPATVGFLIAFPNLDNDAISNLGLMFIFLSGIAAVPYAIDWLRAQRS